MIGKEEARQVWRARKGARAFHPGLSLVEDRIGFSALARLASLVSMRGGEFRLNCEGGEERALARLACVYSLPLPRERTLAPCDAPCWRGPEASMRLPISTWLTPNLTEFDDPELAGRRLSLADELLDRHEFSPRGLLKALGLEAEDPLDKEFGPGELRVRAGNGRESGRWTKNGGVDCAGAADSAPHGSEPSTGSGKNRP